MSVPSSEPLFLKEALLTCFGRYRERAIGPFTPGLNVVYGANEAGKSTLAAFISQVLFGWTSRRGTDNPYEPFSGKLDQSGLPCHSTRRHREGSLLFASASGEWELIRTAGTNEPTIVTTHRGSYRDDAFEELTSGIDRATYDSIFNFDSFELSQLEVKDDALSRLLSASTGSLSSPVDVYRDITARTKESGSDRRAVDGAVMRLKRELEEARAHEHELQQRSAALLDVRAQSLALSSDLAQLRARQVEMDRRTRELTMAQERAHRLEDESAALLRDQQAGQRSEQDIRRELDTCTLAPEDERSLAFQGRLPSLQEAARTLESALTQVQERQGECTTASDALEVFDAVEGAVLTEPSPSLRAAIDARLRERMERVAVRDQAQRLFAEEQTIDEERSAQHVDAQRRAAARTSARQTTAASRRKTLTIVAAGFCCIGVLTAGVGLMVGSLPDYLLAGVELLIAVLVLLLSRRQGSDVSPADVPDETDADAERLARAQRAFEKAAAALEAFDEETARWIASSGFLRARTSLDDARAEWEKARERTDLAAAYTRATLQATNAEAACVSAERVLRERITALGVTTTDGVQAVAWVAQLGARMPQLNERKQEVVRVQGRLRALLDTRAARESRHAAIAAEQEALSSRFGALSPDELPGRLACLLQEAEEAASTLAAELEEGMRRAGEYEEMLRAGLDETELEEAKRAAFALQAQLHEAMQRRAVLVIARHLMQRSIEVWEKDTQPVLLARAGTLLETITDGAWTALRITPDKNVLVRDAAHREFPPEFLSTGTLQQAYLALRIAVLVTATDVGQGLPVVADDILVHFDDDRRVGAARALLELAHHRQVIMSTGHQEVVMLLRQLEPDLNCINL
jgi:uncharacterized protein YhaN